MKKKKTPPKKKKSNQIKGFLVIPNLLDGLNISMEQLYAMLGQINIYDFKVYHEGKHIGEISVVEDRK